MSNSYCSNPYACPGGNCEGCKNGQIWCKDPNCSPYCPQCGMVTTHDFTVNMVVIIILICLLALLFIVWFIYGPQFFTPHSDYEQANIIAPSDYYSK